MHLNTSQQNAVEFVTGPCLVLAGAGSGKTRVIIHKITHLINQCGYQDRHIAAVTFTNKAAREMKERAAQHLGSQAARRIMISTLHTLGLDIIKNEYQALGIKKNFSLFDDQDQLSILKDLSEKWLKKDKDLLKQLVSSIANWKHNLINPDQAVALAFSERDKIFAHCYHLYDSHLKPCNVLDFDDLILLPTLLLQKNREVLERWQQRINYLLVDEYQDTNKSQYELLKLLIRKKSLFTMVGDDDQSIYSWRGARPQNLMLLKEDFPGLHIIKLEQNYRSSQRILKSANMLIANNPHIFKKKLFSELSYGEELKILTANHEDDEAEQVVGELIAHHFINKTSYSDYAILYRGNHQSRTFEKMLLQKHIPYSISGNTSFFSRPEIKDLLAYLRILTNPDDDRAFLRIINTPRREIGLTTLQKLGYWANHRAISLFRASFDLGLRQTLRGRGLETLQSFTSWMQKVSILSEQDPMAALHDLIYGIDYKKWLLETAVNPQAADMRIKNVNQLIVWMKEMLQGNNISEAMTLTQVVTQFTMRDMMAKSENANSVERVQLMTIHASKGLEFLYVYIVGMEEGVLPHHSSISTNTVDEERRLAYVGITRAQKKLVFTLCRERRQYGSLVRNKPSRFLSELPQEDLKWNKKDSVISPHDVLLKRQKSIANIREILKNIKKI
ncbi:DNA helicase Rep [Candidatus Profftia tarda]|uniref:ATP-dependent DNA helicase Rep n=1 Tax=Candidatus Profftia tarda TaxID=1177216 RepID=A0A8E4H484_9ENTR|nr:DNA helicase Rep [Candidatus Profftia tarda]CAD6512483.1 ATP-dependent DNA helicase rep [Candidatus Profftia tarda]